MRKVFVALATVVLLTTTTWAVDEEQGNDRVRSHASSVGQSSGTEEALCTFADGKQLSVRYPRANSEQHQKLTVGKRWPSELSKMFLFTQVALKIGGTTIPAGAFSLYVIPGDDDWTLVVNKNVLEGTEYDQSQDLLRTPMNTGQLSQSSDKFTVYFAQVAPKQCNMRLYYGKKGAWAELREQ